MLSSLLRLQPERALAAGPAAAGTVTGGTARVSPPPQRTARVNQPPRHRARQPGRAGNVSARALTHPTAVVTGTSTASVNQPPRHRARQGCHWQRQCQCSRARRRRPASGCGPLARQGGELEACPELLVARTPDNPVSQSEPVSQVSWSRCYRGQRRFLTTAGPGP